MELREAFEAADTDKGGALELEEVKLNLNNSNLVYRSIWRCDWEGHESEAAQLIVHED